jgi:hypothetical protein
MARVAAVLLLALALSGCLKMDIDLTLDGDQADGSMIVGVNRALLDMSGESIETSWPTSVSTRRFPKARPYVPTRTTSTWGRSSC